jgi:hypothetical protein
LGSIFFLEQLESTLGVKRVFRFAQGDGVEGKTLLSLSLSLYVYIYIASQKKAKKQVDTLGCGLLFGLGSFLFSSLASLMFFLYEFIYLS